MKRAAAVLVAALVTAILLQIAVLGWLSHRFRTQIQCGLDQLMSGQSTGCSVDVTFPPAQARFTWYADGECSPNRASGMNIKVEASNRSGNCHLTVIVFDGPSQNSWDSAMKDIPVNGGSPPPAASKGQSAATGQLSATGSSSQTGSSSTQTARGRGPKVPDARRSSGHPVGLDVNWQSGFGSGFSPLITDSVYVTGTASGVDAPHSRVVLLTLTPSNQWISHGGLIPISHEGSWQGRVDVGMDYAALLVRDSFDISKLQSKLPTVGGDILFVVRR